MIMHTVTAELLLQFKALFNWVSKNQNHCYHVWPVTEHPNNPVKQSKIIWSKHVQLVPSNLFWFNFWLVKGWGKFLKPVTKG